MQLPSDAPAEAPPSPKRFRLEPHHFGLQGEDVDRLSRKLGVTKAYTLPETLSYMANCRMKRGSLCNTTDLVEIWDSIDDNLKLKDKQCKHARMLILGANPRNPSTCTNATDELPNCAKALCSFIMQRCPRAQFNVVSIRSNADKGPHRDLHNGPEDSFIQILEPPKTGGNLWVADAKGSCSMTVHGTKVQGKVVDCTNQPFLFPSKSV